MNEPVRRSLTDDEVERLQTFAEGRVAECRRALKRLALADTTEETYAIDEGIVRAFAELKEQDAPKVERDELRARVAALEERVGGVPAMLCRASREIERLWEQRDRARAERDRLRGVVKAALAAVRMVPKAQAICRERGFVFDKAIDDGWPKLAFTFYSMLCESADGVVQVLGDEAREALKVSDPPYGGLQDREAGDEQAAQ